VRASPGPYRTLQPAEVDPATGYRLYGPDQARTAQVIRRFRDLGMPLDEVRAVLAAPGVTARNAAVSSLRLLLEQQPQPIEVEYRSVPAITVLAIRDRISMGDSEQWWADAFDRAGARRTVRARGGRSLPAPRRGTGGHAAPGPFGELDQTYSALGTYVAEAERLVSFGATRGAEFDEAGAHWITLTDPEGNEFDLVAA
jgi:DNA-binding transcriptional MerR regulator